MAHTIKGETSPPLTPEEAIEAASVALDELKTPHPATWEPEAGQPYRLSILRGLGKATQDRDLALLAHLETGVPTGAITPLPSSFQWPSQDTVDLNDLPPLELCWGNWKAAEEMPEVVAELLQKELDNKWVVETPYTQTEAKEAFLEGVAIGKLNVVIAEGRDPRLVLDSSICNVNGRCQLPERVALPTALDIRLATLDADPHSAFVGAGLDFKAAHKQVKVRPEEHGLLMFRCRGKLYHYVVCHFGGRFSAYWWQRVGAFLLRQCHELLAFAPHKAWLYVDDLLSALHKEQARELFAIMIIFFAAINAPMSWKKAQFAQAINWCGWTVDFELGAIQLIGNKLTKLQGQIDALLKTKKVDRKALEKCIGSLVWATSISSHLRPFLAPLYSDLHSSPGSMYSIPATRWQSFQSLLTKDLVVHREAIGFFLPWKAKVLEYAGRRIYSKDDLPEVPRSTKPQWIRASDPSASRTTLRKDSKECLQWLKHCLSHNPRCPLAIPDSLICQAAADACADGQVAGIGGWIITSSDVAWFAETWHMDEVRATWPFVTKPAQQYINCFETIPQIALMQTCHALILTRQHVFRLPTGSGNTGEEAGLNSLLFTTAFPLSYFLRIAADRAHSKNIALECGHVPGEKNDWADDLSRNRLGRFQHRQANSAPPAICALERRA